MNEVTKGYQLREQMKKINENVQKDLLDYSETELSKNPKNTFMLTAKVTHQMKKNNIRKQLNNVKPYQRRNLTIYMLCIEKVMIYSAISLIFKINLRIQIMLNLNQHSQAIKCLDQALKIDPKYVIAYLNKGNSLRELQQYKQSIACYDKALQLDPTYAKAYINKGDLLLCLKNYTQAIEVYEQAIENCKSTSNEFKNLIIKLKQKK